MSLVILAGNLDEDLTRLARALENAGFVPVTKPWDRAGIAAVENGAVSVIVQATREAHDGIVFCEALRAIGYGGVVILLSPHPSELHVITALEAGADDCLPSPIELELLMARLLACARARPSFPPSHEQAVLLPLPDSPRRALVGGRLIRLTRVEARIFRALSVADAEFVPSTQLQRVACPEAPLSVGSLQVHLAHLRRKLAAEGWRIQNQRAWGYRLLRPTKAFKHTSSKREELP